MKILIIALFCVDEMWIKMDEKGHLDRHERWLWVELTGESMLVVTIS
jgi:hypothetical protein